MKSVIKNFAKTHAPLVSLIYYWLMNNRISLRGVGNVVTRKNAYLRGSRIQVKGCNNTVLIGEKLPSSLNGLRVYVCGSNNKIIIEEGVGATGLTIYVEDDNNLVQIKKSTQISGKTELAAIEGTKIIVGDNSLFSANITFRAGDSHSVIDAVSGVRVNKSKDIILGDHVWIGNTVIVTKGTVIGNHCVVATGSVVTGKTFPDNCAIGGNPAKVVKEGISWLFERI